MDLKGSFVAVVTPMHEDGRIDLQAFKQMLHMHIDAGTKGIIVNGTTGESATLSKVERHELLKFAINEVGSKMLVIAGTGTNSTQFTIDETKFAQEAGADACLIISPYYNCPTQKGLYHHFKAVSDAVELPIILYNHHKRTGVELDADTVVSLSQLPNVVGIKETTSDMDKVVNIAANAAEGFCIYCGNDDATVDYYNAGAIGVISVAANLVPSKMVELCSLAGSKEDTSAIEAELKPLFQALALETNPTPIKWAMHEAGLIESGIRSPLLHLSTQHRPELIEAMAKCEALSLTEEND